MTPAPIVPADATAAIEYRVSPDGPAGNVAEPLATWLIARWRRRLEREAAGEQAAAGVEGEA